MKRSRRIAPSSVAAVAALFLLAAGCARQTTPARAPASPAGPHWERLPGPEGGAVWGITQTTLRGRTVFLAVSESGDLYRSTSGGSWEEVRPRGLYIHGALRVRMPTVISNGALFILWQDLVLRSEDAGSTWRPVLMIGDQTPFGTYGYRWGRSEPLLVGSRHGDGVFVFPSPGSPHNLVETPEAKGRKRVYGIWQSADGGETWEQAPSDLEEPQYVGAVVAAGKGTLYALFGNGGRDASVPPLRSRDGGRTWKPLPMTGGPPGLTGLWVDAGDPHVLWGCGKQGAIYKSRDGGEHWMLALKETEQPDGARRRAESGRPEFPWILGSAADPDTVYAATYGRLWVSRHGGASWVQREAVYRPLLAHPEQRDTLLGTRHDGCPVRSEDAGVTWVEAGKGIPAQWPFGFAVSHTEGKRVLAWQEGFHAALYCEDGRTWKEAEATSFSSQAGCWVASPHDPRRIWWLGSWLRSDDGGRHWRGWARRPDSDLRLDVHRIAFGPMPDSPASATGNVHEGGDYRRILALSEDLTEWRRISTPMEGRCEAVAVADADALYALVSREIEHEGRPSEWEPHLFATKDRGKTWEELIPSSGAVPAAYWIEVFEGDPDRILLLGKSVHVSRDNGKTWADISAKVTGKPGTQADVADHVRGPGGRRLWVALGREVCETRDAGETWRNVTGDLPRHTQRALAYDAEEGCLYAATNRGLYRLKVGK